MTPASRKTRRQRARRIVLKSLGACLAAIVIALATLPYWMGLSLKTLMPKEIVTVSDYETLGYGRFRLSGIQVNAGPIILDVDRLEAPTPSNWAYLAATSGLEPFVVEVGSLAVQRYIGPSIERRIPPKNSNKPFNSCPADETPFPLSLSTSHSTTLSHDWSHFCSEDRLRLFQRFYDRMDRAAPSIRPRAVSSVASMRERNWFKAILNK